ncbi:MAG TPA: chemotaxis protein CheW [Kofleriaceae bacterium]|nr:chemotaxis protein CheW [Kofleriaceae bacterium]
MKDTVDLQEFVGGFIAESDQLVASAKAHLLEIERASEANQPSAKLVRELFRAMHTLKGLAGMMGVQPIVDIAHALETVLRSADLAGGQLGSRACELGFIGVRAIAERVRAVADHKPVPPAPESLIDELARVDVSGNTQSAPLPVVASWDKKLNASERQQVVSALEANRKAYTLMFAPSDQHAARGVSISSVRASLGALGEIVKVAPRSVPATDTAPAGLVFEILVVSDADVEALARAAATTPAQVAAVEIEVSSAPALESLPATEDELTPIGRSVVRVELSRLDELQEQLSALVVTRFRLERQIASLSASGNDIRVLREIADSQGRQLRDLRRAILRVRMVRLSEVLEPLTLLVRSMVKPGIKEARLELDVRDSELDKAVADRLLPALVHLVRNAVDHAIEPVVERERAGKSRAGTVRIESREGAGNQLVLSVVDDGRGIDRAVIARRARKELADDDAVLEVLTAPGFSTREKVTETSGRGIGMDIVRRIVASDLGGELSMTTKVGQGTTFTLEVPLTIAIIDVFSFECAGQPFVVPVTTVEEIFELTEQRRIDSPAALRGRLPVALLERRGRPLPLVELSKMLRISTAESAASKALVVRRQNEPLAFAVDRMLGRHEVVIRPIEDVLARVPGIAGATDLGDGRPTLLLDLVELAAGISGWRTELPS